MAAIAFDRYDDRISRRPVQLVTAPPSRRRPDAAVYRRRRLAVAVLAVAVMLVASHVAQGLFRASASAGPRAAAPVVLVAGPGDSYWSLAASVHDTGDIRSVVDALVDANGGRDLQPGDRIILGR